MARRHLDFYETNAFAVHALRKRVTISGTVIEHCNGLGAISRCFEDCVVITNDIDPEKPATYHGKAQDFCLGEYTPPWQWHERQIMPWVITNPPFSDAFDIVRKSVEAGCPSCYLLRLSWVEPTRSPEEKGGRGFWLKAHPPEAMIVLPRYSFTGDGKTDSVTCARFCWNLPPGTLKGPAIQIAPEGED